MSVLAAATRHVLGIVVVAAVAGLLVAGLALPFVGTAGVAAKATVESFTALPADFEAQPQAQRSVVLDAQGGQLAVFFDENRVYVPLEQVAPVMQQAIVAIEDARYYEHGPIDLQGTARALATNLSSGGVAQGGSTLTQQYVKNVLVTQAQSDEERKAAVETSYARKLRELRLAMAAEEQFTKDQILERYLNIAYYGGGAYGVEAAAQRFFSVPASQLTLAQAATLAGLVQSPSNYDPELYPERAVARRNQVLAAMVNETQAITPEEAAAAAAEPLVLTPTAPTNGCITSYAPFFCDFVYRELLAWEGLGATPEEREAAVRRGGLLIRTTLQPNEQAAAVSAVQKYVAPTDDAIAALAVVEPGTGNVTAMTHSRLYGSGDGRTFLNYTADFDRGGSIGFQNGSTMKTFVLAAAIQQGISLGTKINAPADFTQRKSMKTCEGSVGDAWKVKNYDSKGGTYDLRTGTWRSVNTFFALLEERTGICDPASIAAAGGLTTASGDPLLQVKSFVLGANEVSPLGMAEAYAMFAAGGVHCTSVAITSITTPNGTELPVPPSNCGQVIDKRVAAGVNQVLTGVIDGPDSGRTGAKMTLGRPAAGKTGTTDEAKTIWFIGYTPQRSAAVAVSDPEEPKPLDGIVLNGVRYREACGGCIPGPIWRDAMRAIMDPLPVASFPAPDPASVAGVEATVPDVRGLPGAEAVATLQAAGFEAYVAGEVDAVAAAGTTVSTDPAPGSRYFSTGVVRVFVSTGRAPAEPEPEPEQQEQAADQPAAQPAAGTTTVDQTAAQPPPAPAPTTTNGRGNSNGGGR
jgi:membrane peptidoglycan carboxypeptidase